MTALPTPADVPTPADPHGFHFTRPPLDKPWTWEFVSSELAGRVMLCAWPAEQLSAGKDGQKILLPDRAQKRLHSVAWIVGMSQDCRDYHSKFGSRTDPRLPFFSPGDTVIVPQYVLEQGFSVPGDGNEDLTIVNARDIIMVHRANDHGDTP